MLCPTGLIIAAITERLHDGLSFVVSAYTHTVLRGNVWMTKGKHTHHVEPPKYLNAQ